MLKLHMFTSLNFVYIWQFGIYLQLSPHLLSINFLKFLIVPYLLVLLVSDSFCLRVVNTTRNDNMFLSRTAELVVSRLLDSNEIGKSLFNEHFCVGFLFMIILPYDERKSRKIMKDHGVN